MNNNRVITWTFLISSSGNQFKHMLNDVVYGNLNRLKLPIN